jgi:alpha-tubulin suppressor-like RCC1 family protein
MKRSLTLFAVIVLAVGGSSAQQLVAAKDRSAQARSAPQLGSPKTAVVKAFGRARGTLRLSYASFGLTVNLKGKRGAKPLVWRVSVTKSGVSVARALVGMTTAELRYVAGTGARCSAKACTWHAAGGTVTASLRADHVTRLGLRAPAGNPAGLKLKRGKKGGRLGVTVSDIPKGVAAVVAVNGPGGFVRVLARTSTLSKLSPGLYTIGADTIHAGKYSYVPTPARRSVRVKNARKSGASVSYLTVLPDTTKAATAAAVLSVTGKPGKTQKVTLDENDLGFSPLAPGDILALGVGPKTPYGFFGKVVSVTDSGGQEIVTTAPAKLVEAIPQGDIKLTGTLSTKNVHVTAYAAGGPAGARGNLRTSDFGISSPLDKGVECSPGASLDLSGTAGLTPTFTFNLNWKWGGLRHPLTYTLNSALFKVRAEEKVALAAAASAALNCSLGPFTVFEVTFPPIDVQVGPFPVIFVPKFEIEVGASAKVGAKLTATVTQTLTVEAGAQYAKGHWSPVGSLEKSFTFSNTTPEVSATLEAEATGKFSLLFFDLVGPYVAITPSLEYGISPSVWAPDPWWTLTGKVEGGAGINVSLFGLLDVDWGKPDIVSFSKVLAKGIKHHPTVSTGPRIAVGAYHSCALASGGTVKCWGVNATGQLGDGNGGTGVIKKTPVTVSGITTATAISTGNVFSCALLSSGQVKCWGDNTYNQLGDGTTTHRLAPVAVSGITNATDVSAGGFHGCALISGGTVKCWGLNTHGQVGDNSTTQRPTPVQVSGITTATAISTGGYHTCAILANHTIKCWGRNGDGQLGDGTIADHLTPVAVSGISNAEAISAGDQNTCALLSTGHIECWGSNLRGQLGDGVDNHGRLDVYEEHDVSPTPVEVSGISDASALAIGGNHGCAVVESGGVKCWGYNYYGELGTGTATTTAPYGSKTPVDTVGISDATAVAAGSEDSCALVSGGHVKCWGSNEFGKLGNNGAIGSGAHSAIPVQVSSVP